MPANSRSAQMKGPACTTLAPSVVAVWFERRAHTPMPPTTTARASAVVLAAPLGQVVNSGRAVGSTRATHSTMMLAMPVKTSAASCRNDPRNASTARASRAEAMRGTASACDSQAVCRAAGRDERSLPSTAEDKRGDKGDLERERGTAPSRSASPERCPSLSHRCEPRRETQSTRCSLSGQSRD